MVDLTPEDLIQRLKEGKVYVPAAGRARGPQLFHARQPDRAARAGAAPHRPAGRRADGRLHARARDRRARGRRASACWSASASDPARAALVRYARRLADRLHAPWTALYVETSRAQRLSEAERDRIAEACALAERLGGEAVTVPGRRRRRRRRSTTPAPTTSPISSIAKSQRSRWSELLRGSVAHELIRRAGDISVHVIAEQQRRERARDRPRPRATAQRGPSASIRAPMSAASAIVAAALGVGLVLQQFLGGVEHRAGLPDRGAGERDRLWAVAVALRLPASACSPTISSSCRRSTPSPSPIRENVVALFFFARRRGHRQQSAARVRAQAVDGAAARQDHRGALSLQPQARRRRARSTICCGRPPTRSRSMLKVRVVLLLPEGESIAVRAGYPPEDKLDEADLAAAKWAWQNNRAGRPRRRHAARRQAPVPADAHRARRGRRRRPRQRPAGPAADARPAPAARCAGRPGGARHRAHQSRRGRRPRAARGRDRAAALGAADLDLARSAHAAGLDPRLGHQPRSLSRRARRRGAGRADRARSRRRPSGSTASSPICST